MPSSPLRSIRKDPAIATTDSGGGGQQGYRYSEVVQTVSSPPTNADEDGPLAAALALESTESYEVEYATSNSPRRRDGSRSQQHQRIHSSSSPRHRDTERDSNRLALDSPPAPLTAAPIATTNGATNGTTTTIVESGIPIAVTHSYPRRPNPIITSPATTNNNNEEDDDDLDDDLSILFTLCEEAVTVNYYDAISPSVSSDRHASRGHGGNSNHHKTKKQKQQLSPLHDNTSNGTPTATITASLLQKSRPAGALEHQQLSGTPSTIMSESSPFRTTSTHQHQHRQQQHLNTVPSSSSWDAIRDWFITHPNPTDRYDAIMNYIGELSVTCLHLLCKCGNPPLDILTTILQSTTTTTNTTTNTTSSLRNNIANKMDSFGWLPLHYACASGCHEQILVLLISYSPESTSAQDKRKRTPLHFALGSGASNYHKKNYRIKLQLVNNNNNDGHGVVAAAVGKDDKATTTTTTTNVEFLTPSIVTLLSNHNASSKRDENHMLPLHYACAYGSLSEQSLLVLIQSYPKAILSTDRHGRSPFHFAMGNADKYASPYTVKLLLQYDEKNMTRVIINMFDSEGLLPIHLLAIQAKRNMHLASQHHHHHQAASSSSLSSVASGSGSGSRYGNRGADDHLHHDHHDDTHHHHHHNNNNDDDETDHYKRKLHAKECFQLYLQHEPYPSADFLTALQSLPRWLRDYAVTSQHVQQILNDKIALRFPTFILFMDFYVLVVIIFCFRHASLQCINYRYQFPAYDRTNYDVECGGGRSLLIVLYICATYFFLREIIQALSLWSLGSFKIWAHDPKNWFYVVSFAAVYLFTAAMQIGFTSPDFLRTGIAVTTAMLWGCVISFLKSTLVDFAVFIDGVMLVVKRLVAFLLALGIIIVAFAMMFLTLYQSTEYCLNPNLGNSFCTLGSSLMNCVTMLFRNVDPTQFPSGLGKFVFAVYAFLCVLVLTNVLIAIVIDSYGVIKNERAAMVFWSNRLDFVAEMDAISYYCKCRRRGEYDGAKGDDMIIDKSHGSESVSATSSKIPTRSTLDRSKSRSIERKAWNLLWSIYEDQDLKRTTLEFFFYLILRISGAIIIPLWVIAGLVTAGILWPPQIREWLLIQKTLEEFKVQDQHHNISNFYEVNTLKEDVMRFKSHVKSQMELDRDEIASFRSEAEIVRSTMMSDLTQVSEVLKSIVDMRRTAVKRKKRQFRAAAAVAKVSSTVKPVISGGGGTASESSNNRAATSASQTSTLDGTGATARGQRVSKSRNKDPNRASRHTSTTMNVARNRAPPPPSDGRGYDI